MDKKELLEKWKKFAQKHNLELNPDVDIGLKADTCIKYNGACPCLIKWRLTCPCEDVLDDIKEANACYCMVFRKKGTKIDLVEHNKMTKKVRIKLGIN